MKEAEQPDMQDSDTSTNIADMIDAKAARLDEESWWTGLAGAQARAS